MRSVSVIIPTYNYGRFIKAAIDSALGQTHAPLEVIVVDDGSTDDTAEVVAAFGERVNYIKQENAGVCAARNRGVAESRGELIAFLDADDIWEPTKIAKQVVKFDDPEVGLVHCGMRVFDSDSGETIEFHLEGSEADTVENLLLWKQPLIVGPGGTVMVTRRAFDDAGDFDTRAKVGEDWDFCYRVARKYKVGFVAEPLVNYRSHGASAHLNVDEMERGMTLFYEKAFATEDKDILRLKTRSLSNFHRVMAGSFFHAGRTGKFLEHSTKSILRNPANITYFLQFLLRRLRGKKA